MCVDSGHLEWPWPLGVDPGPPGSPVGRWVTTGPEPWSEHKQRIEGNVRASQRLVASGLARLLLTVGATPTPGAF